MWRCCYLWLIVHQLFYHRSRFDVYLYNYNRFYCHSTLMPYVGLHCSWNRVSFSLVLDSTPWCYWLTHIHWFTVVWILLWFELETGRDVMHSIWPVATSLGFPKLANKIGFALACPSGVKGRPSIRTLTLGTRNSFRQKTYL